MNKFQMEMINQWQRVQTKVNTIEVTLGSKSEIKNNNFGRVFVNIFGLKSF